jgi:SAM-dependent methyltransferase
MKKFIPIFIKSYLKNLMFDLSYSNERFNCPVCDAKKVAFRPMDLNFLKKLDDIQYIHSIFQSETSNVFHYYCSKCLSSDRDRLFSLYINKKLEKSDKVKMIEFAPGKHLHNFIKNNYHNVDFVTADLFRKDVDLKIDLRKMDLESNSMDVFICSHILEHIKEEKEATDELFRILKPGGWGIVMVPIALGLKENLELDEDVSEEERLRLYGQEDHIRMHSKPGFLSLLNGAGFKVLECGEEFFGEDVFKKSGISSRAVLYIVEKPVAS